MLLCGLEEGETEQESREANGLSGVGGGGAAGVGPRSEQRRQQCPEGHGVLRGPAELAFRLMTLVFGWLWNWRCNKFAHQIKAKIIKTHSGASWSRAAPSRKRFITMASLFKGLSTSVVCEGDTCPNGTYLGKSPSLFDI